MIFKTPKSIQLVQNLRNGLQISPSVIFLQKLIFSILGHLSIFNAFTKCSNKLLWNSKHWFFKLKLLHFQSFINATVPDHQH